MWPSQVNVPSFKRRSWDDWLQRPFLWESASMLFAILRTGDTVFLNICPPSKPTEMPTQLIPISLLAKLSTRHYSMTAVDDSLHELTGNICCRWLCIAGVTVTLRQTILLWVLSWCHMCHSHLATSDSLKIFSWAGWTPFLLDVKVDVRIGLLSLGKMRHYCCTFLLSNIPNWLRVFNVETRTSLSKLDRSRVGSDCLVRPSALACFFPSQWTTL